MRRLKSFRLFISGLLKPSRKPLIFRNEQFAEKGLWLFPFICVFGLLTACVNSKTTVYDNSNDIGWMLTDFALVKHFDDSLKLVLFEPDMVKCYHITYKDSIKEKDVEIINHYVRDSLISILSTGQTCVLQYVLLSDSSNYSNDTILVQSPYLPTLEFEFCKKDYACVKIVISTLDRSWQMLSKDKQIHAHSICNVKQVERFCDYFMNIYENNNNK